MASADKIREMKTRGPLLMKKWIAVALPLLVLVLAVASVAAQNDPAAGVARISVEELKRLAKAGTVIVIDVRTLDAYKVGHIPGSLLMPSNEVTEKAKALPKDKTIVTYCS
jgi:phage shock protein E